MDPTTVELARRSLRRRRLGFFAVGGLLFLFPQAQAALGRELMGAVFVLWLALLTWAMLRWFLFNCPRCGQRFFHKPTSSRRQRRNYYSNVCVHCSLELKRPAEAAGSPAARE